MAALNDVPAVDRSIARQVPAEHRYAMGPAELRLRCRHIAGLERTALATPDQELGRGLLAASRKFLTAMPWAALQRERARLEQQTQAAKAAGDLELYFGLRAEIRRLEADHPQAPADDPHTAAAMQAEHDEQMRNASDV